MDIQNARHHRENTKKPHGTNNNFDDSAVRSSVDGKELAPEVSSNQLKMPLQITAKIPSILVADQTPKLSSTVKSSPKATRAETTVYFGSYADGSALINKRNALAASSGILDGTTTMKTTPKFVDDTGRRAGGPASNHIPPAEIIFGVCAAGFSLLAMLIFFVSIWLYRLRQSSKSGKFILPLPTQSKNKNGGQQQSYGSGNERASCLNHGESRTEYSVSIGSPPPKANPKPARSTGKPSLTPASMSLRITDSAIDLDCAKDDHWDSTLSPKDSYYDSLEAAITAQAQGVDFSASSSSSSISSTSLNSTSAVSPITSLTSASSSPTPHS